METNGHWLTIIEYSQLKNLSISTVRRYIKSGHVKSKKENGKYYIFVSGSKITTKKEEEEKELLRLRLKVSEQEQRIKQLEEENNDLKMLVQLYEGGKNNADQQQELPDLPS